MKTTYTNEQLQEAVDRAFRKSSKGHLTTLKYTEDEIWEDQTKTRLVIARAFLDNLLEQTELTKLRAACDRMSKQEVLSLPQLRPLSEAGPVPEGCQRYYFISTLSTGGRVKIQGDTHFADIRLPVPAEKPEPETFEAHGKTWTRHTPGDPMPCDGGWKVYILTSKVGESKTPYKAFIYAWTVKDSDWWGEIIGWRYADEPSVTLPEWTPQAGDVVRLKSGGPLMTVARLAEDDPSAVLCEWFDRSNRYDAGHITIACLKPSTKEDAR